MMDTCSNAAIFVAVSVLLASTGTAFQPLTFTTTTPTFFGGHVGQRCHTDAPRESIRSTFVPALRASSSAVESRSERADIQGQLQRLLDAEELKRRKEQLQEHETTAGNDGNDDEDEGLGRIPNLYELQTVQDYKKLVEDCDNKLTVVQFSAPFCLACKAALPLVRKMARDSPDVNVVLVSVTKANRHDVRDLGVPSLPYGYVHHPQRGLVEALSTNKRHWPDFAGVVESYRRGECALPAVAGAESGGAFASPFVRAT